MTATLVDSRGALLEFHGVPPQRTPGSARTAGGEPRPAAMDWQVVFDAVRWPRDRFTPATPEWTPPRRHRHPRGVDRHRSRSWERRRSASKPAPSAAASSSCRPSARGRSRRARRRPNRRRSAARCSDLFLAFLILTLIVGSALLARRNMRARPRRSAGRLARGRRAGRAEDRCAGLVAAHHVPDYRRRAGRHPRRDRADALLKPASCGSPISASSRGCGGTGRPACSRGAGCSAAAVPRSARRPRRPARRRLRRRPALIPAFSERC